MRITHGSRGSSQNRPKQERNGGPVVKAERKINNLMGEPGEEGHSVGPVVKQKAGGNRNMTPIGTSSGRTVISELTIC